MITGVAHLCFTVADLERSEDFYCNKLGLKKAFEFLRDTGERFGLYIHAGRRTFIELFKGEVGPKAEKQTFRHTCLEVDDIEATVEKLRANGVDIGDITLGSDNTYQAWFEDPDGNRFELHCYTADSKQGPFLA